VKRAAFSSRNGGNHGRKLSVKELHSISTASLLNDKVVASLFPPCRVDVFNKARTLKGKARKKTGH
jgi:hypothetical protein